ncbi:shikimate dehydrogenase [Halobacillus sp. ACCC02827]|uniref:shikimate dehydrogenase n=1 Tax=Halobacillus sp. ACCC02827 TaxID=3052090 RepID=UPI002570E227|nr:shikimate dehydrogenase [Halobacillus sp. ACCC02827]WJE14460.1 shikimate dehydrogenase [Halobacillus sp. ACCC02827]
MLNLGLIGHPVGHSLSPWIHNQLMQQQGLNGEYKLYDIDPEQFDERMAWLKTQNLDGFNVTVPYKEKIIAHLDGLDTSARHLGAVNTVKCTEEGWIGYNTDGIGFVYSLKQRYPDLFNGSAKALLLGSGGAARGIFEALIREGIREVNVSNRTVERAEKLIKELPFDGKAVAVTLADAEQTLGMYDLVIQTTTVGMSPEEDSLIIAMERLTKGTVVSDIVYRPMKTKLLAEADKRGARLHFGHEMLLQQAVYAFSIWTGTSPESKLLLQEFEQKLKGV